MEYKMKVPEVIAQYKIILEKLWQHRDLETILYLRILCDTGFRPREAYLMKPEYLIQGKACLPPQYFKFCNEVEWMGGYPKLSCKTQRIAEAVSKKQGSYFTKSQQDYMTKIKLYRTDERFTVYELRNMRIEMRRWIYKGKVY